MNTPPPFENTSLAADTFLGLAPFLRKNIAGMDLQPIGREMLAELQIRAENTNLWMNLSLVMFCLGQREIAFSMQNQALAQQRIYYLPASSQPAKLRMLLLTAPGDLAANTPIDCLLEHGDIDLIYYFVDADQPKPTAIPDHDILMVAIGEADENLGLLTAWQAILEHWPKPVINAPGKIKLVARNAASELLQNIDGLLMPLTFRIPRSLLPEMTLKESKAASLLQNCNFPLIIRPVGSHAGRDLDKLTGAEELTAYLARVDAEEFFLSPFIDYSGRDGLFRKYRLALIEGEPYPCHMAVSAHWMIHYVNAGMYEDELKRNEEAAYMAGFADFAQRHQAALAAIYKRTQLEYLCMDCAAPWIRNICFHINGSLYKN
ncbi:MAG: hypothetical protein ABSB19_18475 [Methylomonas sp.]